MRRAFDARPDEAGFAERGAHPASGSVIAGQVLSIALYVGAGIVLAFLVLKYTLGSYLLWAQPETTINTWLSSPRTVIAFTKGQLTAARVEQESEKLAQPIAGLAHVASRLLEHTNLDVAKSRDPDGQPAVAPSAPVATHEPAIERVPVSTLKIEVTKALLAEPLNASGFRSLALISEIEGDIGLTRGLMEAAARLSRTDPVSHYWLMTADFNAKNYAGALHYADVLLRAKSGSSDLALPVLAKLAEENSLHEEFVEVLKQNPPWRANFFASITRYSQDIRAPLVLMQTMSRLGAPPTAAEQFAYMRFLIANRRTELAYYSWLQSLTATELQGVTTLRNGTFEEPLTENPFDWQMPANSGATVARSACPSAPSSHCLFADFGASRLTGPLTSQILVLPPGTFRLTGRYRGEIQARRGLVWRVECSDGASNLLGETEQILLSSFQWRTFDTTFTVPADKCSAQRLLLLLPARSPSEQIATGTIWFDDLAVVREIGPEATTRTPQVPAAP